MPPFANRRRVAAWRLPYFFASGQASHDDLVRAFTEYVDRPLGDLTVLELACGPGRISQYFASSFASFTVSDVDASAVRYLSRNFSDMTAVVNTSEPPLPFPSASFDVSYSWSLWTHLPLHLQKAYLRSCGVYSVREVGPS